MTKLYTYKPFIRLNAFKRLLIKLNVINKRLYTFTYTIYVKPRKNDYKQKNLLSLLQFIRKTTIQYNKPLINHKNVQFINKTTKNHYYYSIKPLITPKTVYLYVYSLSFGRFTIIIRFYKRFENLNVLRLKPLIYNDLTKYVLRGPTNVNASISVVQKRSLEPADSEGVTQTAGFSKFGLQKNDRKMIEEFEKILNFYENIL